MSDRNDNGPAVEAAEPQKGERSQRDVSGDHTIIRLSLSQGPISNTRLSDWPVRLDRLAERLSHRPAIGPKDGSYYCRGPATGPRSDANIPTGHAVILDGDRRIDIETGEVIDGAPHPSEVHRALADAGVIHIVYTSASHRPDRPRYRVLIPADLGSDHAALAAVVDHLIALIQAAGVPLASVVENYAWSQGWFLPRVATADSEYLSYAHLSGALIDVAPILERWQREQPAAPAASSEPGHDPDPDSPIGRYLARHGRPRAMAAHLEQHGYVLVRAARINGHPAWRFRAPGSASGEPGVLLYRSRSGVWRVYSHHGDHDPLAAPAPDGQRVAHDAVDLVRILDHGGDWKATLSAIDERPIIGLGSATLLVATRKSIRALAATEPPAVYDRAGSLVRVVTLTEPAAPPKPGDLRVPAGTPAVRELGTMDMRLELARQARYQRATRKGEIIDIDPPAEVALAVLSSVGRWQGIRPLIGLCECPVIRPDGAIRTEPGYDPQTGLYLTGGWPELDIPSRPTREDAIAAANKLLEPFSEFRWAYPETDRSIVLAYILTLLLRAQLDRAPAFGFGATAPGSGKGLLVECANILVRGRNAATVTAPAGRDADAESAKMLFAALLQGAPSILIDEQRTPVGNAAINTILTTDRWKQRVLGESRDATVTTRVTLAFAGNGLRIRGDTVRRALTAVIDPACERPETRRFEIVDLPEYIRAHRAQLLSAALTIPRAYRLAGEPGAEDRLLGSFSAWSRAVCAPIRWLGLADPTDCQDRQTDLDPEREQLDALLAAWHGCIGDRWITVAELIESANEPVYGVTADTPSAALREALTDLPGWPSAKSLGWYLRRYAGRIVAGRTIRALPRQQGRVKYAVRAA